MTAPRLLARLLLLLIPLTACGGSTEPEGQNNAGAGQGGTSGAGGSGGASGTGAGSAAGQGGAPDPDCKDTPQIEGEDTGYLRCNGGPVHRPEAKVCPSKLPSQGGQCDTGQPPNGISCQKDEECTDAPHGYCAVNDGGAFFCSCRYGCTEDKECKKGQICLCGGNIGVCVGAACSRDADCGTGSLCMSYTVVGGCSASTAFACTTAEDQCLTDQDCQGGTDYKVCGHDGKKRLCVEGPLACPGRLLIVEARPRQAPLRGVAWC